MTSLRDTHFIVLDVETTGLNPLVDKIVDIAAVHVLNSVRGVPYRSLVNPEMPIPPEASAVHHIVDRDVEDAPKMDKVLPIIENVTKDAIVVAHNARFDASFLPITKPWLCTYRLARHLYPDLPHHSNQYLRYRFHLNFGVWEQEAIEAHRAYGDAMVTAHLLVKMVGDYLFKGNPDDSDALMAFVNAPIEVQAMPFGKHKEHLYRRCPRIICDGLS